MQPRNQWTEDERVWFELFKAAVTGRCATAIDVRFAEQDADVAFKILNARIKPKEPPPLFQPLLEKRAKDEDDSYFQVTR